MGRQEFTRAACIGTVRLQDAGAGARRHPPLPRRARPAWARRARVHERGLAGADHRVPAEQVLSLARGLPRRPRRRDAARIRGDRRGRVRAPARLPRPRDVAPHRLPGLDEASFLRTIEANVEALNAATANIPAERMRLHICWGNYEGPHDHDIPLEKVHRRRAEGAARDDAVRGGQSAPRARVDRVARRDNSRRQDARARPDRYLLELCRAPRADRAAPRALYRDRRRRPCRREHGLRLRHVRRLRQDRSGRRLEEAGRAERGRRLAAARA